MVVLVGRDRVGIDLLADAFSEAPAHCQGNRGIMKETGFSLAKRGRGDITFCLPNHQRFLSLTFIPFGFFRSLNCFQS